MLVAKAIDEEGVGSDQYVSDSIDWCVEEGADIISLSLGGDQGIGSGFFTTDSLEQSVEDALDSGVFVIAAAGNDGEDDDGDGAADCDDSDCEAEEACQDVPAGPLLVRGDADDNGAVQLTDGIFILNFLFLGGSDPTCDDAADADDSGAIQLTDGIFILNFLFLGGADTPPPGGFACGPDPDEAGSPLDSGCENYSSCP